MIHYISDNGDVYGFKPADVECREMSDEEFQNFKYPKTSEDDLFLMLRSTRDTLLTDTDKYLIADYPISPEELETIKTYRQALRDLTAQPGAPWDGGDIPWPIKPNV